MPKLTASRAVKFKFAQLIFFLIQVESELIVNFFVKIVYELLDFFFQYICKTIIKVAFGSM